MTSPPGSPGYLARLAPRTLEPESEVRVRVRGYLSGWGRSPDGRALALGVTSRSLGRLQIVDLRRWRTRALLQVGPPPSSAVTTGTRARSSSPLEAAR